MAPCLTDPEFCVRERRDHWVSIALVDLVQLCKDDDRVACLLCARELRHIAGVKHQMAFNRIALPLNDMLGWCVVAELLQDVLRPEAFTCEGHTACAHINGKGGSRSGDGSDISNRDAWHPKFEELRAGSFGAFRAELDGGLQVVVAFWVVDEPFVGLCGWCCGVVIDLMPSEGNSCEYGSYVVGCGGGGRKASIFHTASYVYTAARERVVRSTAIMQQC